MVREGADGVQYTTTLKGGRSFRLFPNVPGVTFGVTNADYRKSLLQKWLNKNEFPVLVGKKKDPVTKEQVEVADLLDRKYCVYTNDGKDKHEWERDDDGREIVPCKVNNYLGMFYTIQAYVAV